jgi:hypothetical protein
MIILVDTHVLRQFSEARRAEIAIFETWAEAPTMASRILVPCKPQEDGETLCLSEPD